MAKVTALTTVTVIVVVTASIVASEKRPFLHYSKYLQKALPDHWQHDQENLNRRVDTIAWRHQVRGVEPPLPPLRDPPPLSWQSWAKRGRRAAKEGYRDKEREKVRTQQLQEKLRLNHLQPKRVGVIPHPRPRVEERNHLRRKRQVETESKSFMEKLRSKRDVVISPQLKPEMVMQQRIEPSLQQDKEEQKASPSLSFHFYNPSIYYPEVIDSLANKTCPYQENVKEKREKRQIVYLVNQPPEWRLYKQSRTTPNPFIRETNMDDYEIVRPNPNPGPTGSRQESYQLSETSDLEYESDYTITMSDSEDWENYPLTTPSGPNPGWGLSTLADIYQRPKQRKGANMQPPVMTMTRVKRSPKQKKRRIGARKEKLKQRRKLKEIRRKRRIIRNSKEDKAVKEDAKDAQAIEELLNRPRLRPRQNVYKKQETSQEVLWSNDTHKIVEDRGATFSWVNKTHYKIYKENATDEWYKHEHVLVAGEEYWENKTQQEQESEEQYSEYSEDYSEEFTREEEEEARREKKGKEKRLNEKNKEIEVEESGEMKGKAGRSKDWKEESTGKKVKGKMEEEKKQSGHVKKMTGKVKKWMKESKWKRVEKEEKAKGKKARETEESGETEKVAIKSKGEKKESKQKKAEKKEKAKGKKARETEESGDTEKKAVRSKGGKKESKAKNVEKKEKVRGKKAQERESEESRDTEKAADRSKGGKKESKGERVKTTRKEKKDKNKKKIESGASDIEKEAVKQRGMKEHKGKRVMTKEREKKVKTKEKVKSKAGNKKKKSETEESKDSLPKSYRDKDSKDDSTVKDFKLGWEDQIQDESWNEESESKEKYRDLSNSQEKGRGNQKKDSEKRGKKKNDFQKGSGGMKKARSKNKGKNLAGN